MNTIGKKTFFFGTLLVLILSLFSLEIAANQNTLCFSGNQLFDAAKRDGVILFGEGYTFQTQKEPLTVKISMMYDRHTTEWSFVATYPESDIACFIEGGKNWIKTPLVFPEGFGRGGNFEERVGRCDSFDTLKETLLQEKHKADIGYGSIETGIPGKKIETHFFVDGSGGWTAVQKMIDTVGAMPPLGCIESAGYGWKFLDYYETHLPSVGK